MSAFGGKADIAQFQSRRALDCVKTRDGRKMELRLVNWKHAENGNEELDNGAVQQRGRRTEGAAEQNRLCLESACGTDTLSTRSIAPRQRPQSSSASRVTAGAFGFLTLSQSGERPRR
jgi:hypothetical protein